MSEKESQIETSKDGLNENQMNILKSLENLDLLDIAKSLNSSDKKKAINDLINNGNNNLVDQKDKINLYNNKLSIKNINDSEFYRYFGEKNFRQGKLGNCYFVSSLRSLMENSSYKKLIINSVKIVNSNGKIKRFIVKMPLGEPNGESVSIESDDINQKQYVIKNGKRIERSGISKGPLGVKILEAAYNEYVLGKDNGNLVNMEGGFGSLAILNLLGRENVKIFNYELPKQGKIIERENGSKAAFQQYKPNFENISNGDIKNFLLGFNPNQKIVTLGSIAGKSDKNTYTVGGKILYYNHAYSLVGVSKDGNNIKNINVINPHDTSRIISLTYNEFLSAFSNISGAKLTKNFMDNKTNSNTNTVFDVKPRR